MRFTLFKITYSRFVMPQKCIIFQKRPSRQKWITSIPALWDIPQYWQWRKRPARYRGQLRESRKSWYAFSRGSSWSTAAVFPFEEYIIHCIASSVLITTSRWRCDNDQVDYSSRHVLINLNFSSSLPVHLYACAHSASRTWFVDQFVDLKGTYI